MRRCLFTFLLLCSTVPVFAQVGEVSLSVGEAKLRNNSLGILSSTTGSAELKAETDFRLGFRFTWNNDRHYGYEVGYAYNHGKLTGLGTDTSLPVHQGSFGFLLYATREGSRVRPFAVGGVHFSSFYPPGSGVFQGNGVTKFGVNYGGGVKARLTDMWGVRFDVRDYANGKPDFGTSPSGWMRQLEVSAGVSFLF
jgi:opacity protein-like surface antigen